MLLILFFKILFNFLEFYPFYYHSFFLYHHRSLVVLDTAQSPVRSVHPCLNKITKMLKADNWQMSGQQKWIGLSVKIGTSFF